MIKYLSKVRQFRRKDLMAKSQKPPQDNQVRKPIERPEGWVYLKALRMLGECVINTDTSKASEAEMLDMNSCHESYYRIILSLKGYDLRLPEDEIRELLRQSVQVFLKGLKCWPPDFIDFLNKQYRYGLGLSKKDAVNSLQQLLDEYADPKEGWQINLCDCGCSRITEVSSENYRQEQAKEPCHYALLDLLLTGGSRILH